MIRNRNGYWMSTKFFAMWSPDDGGGAGGGAAGDSGSSGDGAGTGDGDSGAGDSAKGGSESDGGNDTIESLNAEIARLRAENAKQKDAINNATKEAGNLRKELRSKMTQEQIDAETKREAEEKAAKELEDLRREVAKGKTVKTVMGKLGLDEDTAGNLADHLFGAADIENALLEIQKAWQAKEKALRLEYGKITGPGAGADSNSPEARAVQMASSIGKAKNAANEQAQKALNAYIR